MREYDDPPRPHVLGGGILIDGQDPGAARRAEIRSRNAARQAQAAARAAQRAQEREVERRRGRTAQMPAKPLKQRRVSGAVHPEGLGRLLAALTIQGKAEGMQPEAEVTY